MRSTNPVASSLGRTACVLCVVFVSSSAWGGDEKARPQTRPAVPDFFVRISDFGGLFDPVYEELVIRGKDQTVTRLSGGKKRTEKFAPETAALIGDAAKDFAKDPGPFFVAARITDQGSTGAEVRVDGKTVACRTYGLDLLSARAAPQLHRLRRRIRQALAKAEQPAAAEDPIAGEPALPPPRGLLIVPNKPLDKLPEAIITHEDRLSHGWRRNCLSFLLYLETEDLTDVIAAALDKHKAEDEELLGVPSDISRRKFELGEARLMMAYRIAWRQYMKGQELLGALKGFLEEHFQAGTIERACRAVKARGLTIGNTRRVWKWLEQRRHQLTFDSNTRRYALR